MGFWKSNFNFMNDVESTNQVFCSSPTIQRCIIVKIKHLVKGVSPTQVWNLMMWPSDQNSNTQWSSMHLSGNLLQIAMPSNSRNSLSLSLKHNFTLCCTNIFVWPIISAQAFAHVVRQTYPFSQKCGTCVITGVIFFIGF